MNIRLAVGSVILCGAFSAGAVDLFFAGDSTLHQRRDNPSKDPYELVLGSWGDETADYLKPGVAIRNHAWSGASTKSFWDNGTWNGLLGDLKPGDWVVIEFGHNDQKVDKPFGTRADSTYRDNLRRMVGDVRTKGAKPLVCSSIVRYDFDADGKLKEYCYKNGFRLSDYCRAAEAVAKEMDVPFVDMQKLTRDAAEKAGPAEALTWYRASAFPEKGDYTHPTLKGAKVLAKLFVDDVKARTVPIAELYGETDLPDAAHDCGGVSFDFNAVSEAHNEGMFDGANLMTNAWKGVYTDNTPHAEIVKLSDAEGGMYRISCRAKVCTTNRLGTGLMVQLGTAAPKFAENPARNGRWIWCPLVNRNDDYFPATTAFAVRPGETHARVSMWNRRQFLDIRDLTLKKEKPANDAAPLRIGVQFSDILDGRFALAAGQTVALAYNVIPVRHAKWHPTCVKVRFELPDGVRLVDQTKGVQIGGYSHWNATYALLEATGPVGGGGTGRIVGTYDDGRQKFDFSSKPIQFEIIPTIRVPVPARYRNGVFSTRSFDFTDIASCDRYAESMSDYGCRWIIPTVNDAYPALPAWRKYGMWVTPYSRHCANGYKIGDRNVPVEDQYVSAGKNAFTGKLPPANDRMCPLAVAGRSEYYRTKVEPLFARSLAGTDGAWCNWEPYMFEGVGCCCDRCRRAFAEYVKKPEAEIAVGWPTNVLKGGAWAKEAVKFRSICHGKLARTVSESIRKATGDGPVGFLPAVHFEQMAENWRERQPLREAQEIEYAGSLKWIQPWGPYVPWFTDKLYCRERGKYVNHCLAARTVRKAVDRDYPLPNRPKLLAGPQGYCDGWLTQPENFKMAFDAYFFNRYEGCAPWMFPVGADARIWRAFADATALAAKYETIVWDGMDVTEKMSAETVSEYAAPIRQPSVRFPKLRDISHLFIIAHELKTTRIAAVLNCWQDGEAFLTLKARDLKPGAYELVSDDGVLWAKGRAQTRWTSEELAMGVFVSVGAARTRVFEIRPTGVAAPTRVMFIMTADRVRMDYAARKDALTEAAAKDAVEAKAHSGVPTRDD